jgi:hypothetical protein
MRFARRVPPSPAAAIGLSFALATLLISGCTASTAGNATESTSDTTAAINSATDADGGGGAEKLTSCLTTYVDCLRATGADDATCKEALHECLRPPPPRPGPGTGLGPPPGDDGGLPPPPPPPPPPPLDGGAAGGPRACFVSLDACAAGTDSVDVCVADAVNCLSAFPPPPPPPPPPPHQ